MNNLANLIVQLKKESTNKKFSVTKFTNLNEKICKKLYNLGLIETYKINFEKKII